jgi:hypothetical protein
MYQVASRQSINLDQIVSVINAPNEPGRKDVHLSNGQSCNLHEQDGIMPLHFLGVDASK